MKLFDLLFGKKRREETKPSENEAARTHDNLPAFLKSPDDPISRKMFEDKMQPVLNQRCGYRFKLYTGIADPTPEVKQQSPSYEINQTDVYWKADSPSCCSVSTMKTPSVKTSSLRGWVESTDMLAELMGGGEMFLNLPDAWEDREYRRVGMRYLGQNGEYNRMHGFEESHAFCHVFSLDDTLYKKFLLCARKGEYAWKVECTVPSGQEDILPTDLVPPGQVFGSFYPVE